LIVNLEVAMKKSLYINTAPKVNVREDGSTFYTVMVGVVDSILKEKTGKARAEWSNNLTITMDVFAEKVEIFTKAATACEKSGKKLVLECEDIVITEVKPNIYVKDGVTVEGFKASAWGTGETQLNIVSGKFTISAELAEMMGELDDDDI
jgi:hypothetical protein